MVQRSGQLSIATHQGDRAPPTPFWGWTFKNCIIWKTLSEVPGVWRDQWFYSHSSTGMIVVLVVTTHTPVYSTYLITRMQPRKLNNLCKQSAEGLELYRNHSIRRKPLGHATRGGCALINITSFIPFANVQRPSSTHWVSNFENSTLPFYSLVSVFLATSRAEDKCAIVR